jgi:hypothetical protein
MDSALELLRFSYLRIQRKSPDCHAIDVHN